jgi:DNA invertase Pin-like site-specific DNA recombinase
MENKTKRVIGYVRVSTAQQALEGLSLPAQRERIEAWAKAGSHALVAMADDAGISGKSVANRPGLQRALGFLRAGMADTLVVVRLDRLSRSLADFTQLLRTAEREGWHIVSLSEDLNTSTPSGRLVTNILAALCEHERDLISARTTEAMAQMRQQNLRRGSVPYGYALAPDGKTLVPNHEMPTVKKILALRRKKGTGFAMIAALLNALDIPARGERWYGRTVYNVFQYHKDNGDAA